MPWTVFSTIARAALESQFDREETERNLIEIAGFAPLRELLQNRFVKRGHLLRWYRIVSDAARLLSRFRRFQEAEFLKQLALTRELQTRYAKKWRSALTSDYVFFWRK